jgi:hypothetical protein
MVKIYDENGYVISRSKNLRGINDRCRKVPGAKATVSVFNDWAAVEVIWPDGSFSIAQFNSVQLAYKYAATKRFQGAV